jgi:acyl-CoA thioester hydrolase
MKNDAWRRQYSGYPVHGELLPRLTDVDLWQHLNNAALISMHDENCQRWLRGLFGAAVWRETAPLIATVSNATDFLAEAHYPAPLATGVRLLGHDAAGFRLGSALFQGGHCVGLHQATLALWSDGQPAPMTEAVADALHSAAALQPALPHEARLAPPPVLAGPLPALDEFPWTLRLDSRFADNDARSQTSDVSLARYAEQARVQFLTQTFGAQRMGSSTGFVVGHVALRWLARRRAPLAWQVGCAVTRVGERSVGVRSVLFDGAVPVAVGDTVLVVIDRETRRSSALPPSWRDLLEPHRLATAPPC